MQKINIKNLLRFGKTKEVRPLHFILANRGQQKFGEIDNIFSVNYHPQLKTADELSFVVYKEADGKKCRLWDELIQFRLIWVKEYNEWFEITVEVDESDKVTKKLITATPLPAAELSQINMNSTEINTEADIARTDYMQPTIFYNPDMPNASLLHRVLEKAPNYTIKHVDTTLQNIQRAFTIDNSTTIYDFLTNTLSQEIGCLFLFDSNERGIYVYDMETTCLDCGHRDDTDFSVCPECGGTQLHLPYGFDTAILIDKNNLGSGIQLTVNTDAIKNCFRITGGDEIVNATIRNINPNGTDCFYYFNEDTRKDMPDELVDKIERYEQLTDTYNSTKEFIIADSVIQPYNAIVDQIAAIYMDSKYTALNSTYTGFPNIIQKYYDAIDFSLYLENGMMPTWKQTEKTAAAQMALLRANLKIVSVADISNISNATADNAVTLMAKAIIDTGSYKFEILSSSLTSQIWRGKVKLTNYADSADTETSDFLTVEMNDDFISFVNQRIEKLTAKIDTQGIKDLFSIDSLTEFKEYLKKYCLGSLTAFENAYQTAIDVLAEEKISEEKADLYEQMYIPYYDRLKAIEAEMRIREADINAVKAVQEALENIIEDAHTALDFEQFLGSSLWNIFIRYRREDNYHNENYISDGLDNAKLVELCSDLIHTARNELIKSGEKQYAITASLNNLLLMKDENGSILFEPILEDFTLGNFIRCKIDGKIYKMRIADVTIDYDNLSQLSVTFYDVTTVKSLTGKAKSLFDTVQSMGTTYSAVKRQAKKGADADYSIERLRKEGLDSAQFNIFSTNAQTVLDEHGLLSRGYDEINDVYSDEQMRLNGADLIFTDNNWRSTKLAIGKQVYHLGSIVHEEYGVNADFVLSGKIISGDLYSANYEKNGQTVSGSHIDLNNGSFSLADGKMVFDNATKNFTLKDINVSWQSAPDEESTAPLAGIVAAADGLEKKFRTLNQSVADNQNYISTMIRESADGIEIGKSDSAVKAHFTNNKIEFTNETETIASIDQGKFYGKDLELMQEGSLRMGNQIWLRRGNGHLSLKSLL